MNNIEKYIIRLDEVERSKVEGYDLSSDFFATIEESFIQGGDVQVELTITRGNEGHFELLFQVSGSVQVECDRCLSPMMLDIDAEQVYEVCVGEEDTTEDRITLSHEAEDLDVSWMMYETMVLALPIRHVHEDGACDEQMRKVLERCLVEEDAEDKDESSENKTIDPRWEGLRNILDK